MNSSDSGAPSTGPVSTSVSAASVAAAPSGNPPSLAELRQFMAVAEAGSFSAAARRLGQTPATLSVAVRRLESSLGARLFERSTRSVRLTEGGERFFQQCSGALEMLGEAVDQLQQGAEMLTGTVSLSAPTDLARTLLSRWLQEFLIAHPQIHLELRVTDRLSHLISEPVDLAVRYGQPADSQLVARPLAPCRRLLCAAPEYLARFGEPRVPEDLAGHRCLCFKLADRVDSHWQFFRGADAFPVQVSPWMVTDDSGLAREWAVAGQGLIYKSEWDMADDISTGRLVPLLGDFQGSESPLFLVYSNARHLPRRVRALVDYLLQAAANVQSPLAYTG